MTWLFSKRKSPGSENLRSPWPWAAPVIMRNRNKESNARIAGLIHTLQLRQQRLRFPKKPFEYPRGNQPVSPWCRISREETIIAVEMHLVFIQRNTGG